MERLDKTAFKKHSCFEASHSLEYWLSKTVEERLRAAHYLNSVAYNFPIDNPPKIDRTIFKATKRG